MGFFYYGSKKAKWGFNRRGSVDKTDPESSQMCAMTRDASCNKRNADLIQGTKFLHKTGAAREQVPKEAVGPPSRCSKNQPNKALCQQSYIVLELSLFEQKIGLETSEVLPT